MRSKPRLLFWIRSKLHQSNRPPPQKQNNHSTIKNQPSTRKNENPTTQQRSVQADNGKKTVRLHFKETEQKKPTKLSHIAKEALTDQRETLGRVVL